MKQQNLQFWECLLFALWEEIEVPTETCSFAIIIITCFQTKLSYQHIHTAAVKGVRISSISFAVKLEPDFSQQENMWDSTHKYKKKFP